MFKGRFVTVSRVLGMLLMMEAAFMLLSIGVSLLYDGRDTMALLNSAILTFLVGFFLRVPLIKRQTIHIDQRLGFLIVALIWAIMSAFGALPLYLGGYASYTDAYFETMSGFTTTGASVIRDVESLPRGILFWRQLTNAIGGIGIVVIVISLSPFVGGGAMAMFSAEVAGPDKGKLSPHIKKTGSILLSIYVGLITLSTLWLWIGGMSLYDAVCHSFAAMASGGLSTKNYSAAAFSPLIQYLLILSMIPSGINFTLMYYFIKKQYKKIWINEEIKTYFAVIIVATVILTALIYDPSVGLETSFRHAIFQVVSLSTSTGFVNADFSQWATPAVFLLFLLMFSGAMSGSTSGGLKIVRIILLFKMAKNIIKRSVHSRAVFPLRFEKKIVEKPVLRNVLTMFLLFLTTYICGVLLFIILGIDFLEASGAAISFLSNMGPGLGKNGGFNNYADFPLAAKWIGSFLMFAGRLELITVFVLFMPSFWKKSF
ncbi:MAG: TrkH family potassium uptake protein [Bacteroidaceae bacterium]|nr:TrkH family potassium uptake protein [Bacteroidaceae bacterium]